MSSKTKNCLNGATLLPFGDSTSISSHSCTLRATVLDNAVCQATDLSCRKAACSIREPKEVGCHAMNNL